MGVHKLDTKIYVGQKAFINKDSKLLVLRDAEENDLDFPGGKYRWGADIKEELLREVAEETALDIEIGVPFVTWTAEHGGGTRKIFLIGYLCEYESGEVRLSKEHSEFEWVDKNTYKNWRENTDYFRVLEDFFERRKGT